MADPLSILRADHREVEHLLERLSKAEQPSERSSLLDEIESALALHMEIEETLVYAVVEEVEGDEPREEAEVEHDLAREGLQKARAMTDVPGFGAVVEMLKAGIEHHVDEEEKEILPALRKELDRDQWNALGDAIVRARAAAGRPVPDAATSTSTRASGRKAPANKAAAKKAAAKKAPAQRAATKAPPAKKAAATKVSPAKKAAARKAPAKKAAARSR